ncbi:MAG: phospholipid carrier-dependent glycosyltransferase [Desulfococcaceae bacterium]
MKKSAAAVFILYVLLYILPLGARPLFIPDETRYFEIPREMIASGDWVVPRINGIRYFEKPVLGYWFNAVSMLIFGENAFAVRFPAAMSAGISALCVFLLARRFAGDYSTGILASVIFLTSAQVLGIGTFSVLDGPLSMLLTVALTVFFFAYHAEGGAQKRILLFLAGVFCGLAFLCKGFLAFAVPVLVMIPWMIWEGRFAELLKTAWLPLAGAIAVSLPWSLMIHLREGDFWHYFFWIEHVNRFLKPGGGQHPEAFWFFIPCLLAGLFPWTFLFPAILQGLRDMDISDTLMRFCLCWFIFPFLFFSASSGKLLTYILPCFPAVAILMAAGLRNYSAKGENRLFGAGARVLAVLIGITAIVLLISQITGFTGIRPYDNAGEIWKWILACTGLVLWAFLAFYSAKEKRPDMRIILFATAPLVFFVSAQFVFPDMVLKRKAPGTLLQKNAGYIQPGTVVVSDGDIIRAVSAYYKRSDVWFFITEDELGYGLSYEDAKKRMLDTEQLNKMIRDAYLSAKKNSQTGSPLVLIARTHKYEKYRNRLPQPVYRDEYGKFVFLQF